MDDSWNKSQESFEMVIKLKQISEYYKDIIYLAGRGCYGMEDISDLTTDKQKSDFVKKLVELGHESVLEHCYISLQIINCSRSFMAQLTRHRLCAFSIKSQHYVKHGDFKVKDIETDNSEAQYWYKDTCEIIRRCYMLLCKLGVPHYVAREILPNGTLTNIFMTANFREWRHIIKLRQTKGNTPEIREFALKIKEMFQKIFPEVFFDL